MEQDRYSRLENVIKRELGAIIAKTQEFEDSLVTVTRTHLRKRREHVDVYIAVFPKEKKEAAFEELKRGKNELQYKLMKRLRTRPIPKINFVYDKGAERAAIVEKKLLELEEQGEIEKEGEEE